MDQIKTRTYRPMNGTNAEYHYRLLPFSLEEEKMIMAHPNCAYVRGIGYLTTVMICGEPDIYYFTEEEPCDRLIDRIEKELSFRFRVLQEEICTTVEGGYSFIKSIVQNNDAGPLFNC